jgi:hypothetical protein
MIMTSPDKPLHVRVAEVLGWRNIFLAGNFMVPDSDLYMGHKPGEMLVGKEGLSGVPRYDLLWSATGPLIERFGIGVWKDWPTSIDPWTAHADKGDAKEYGATALLAVCNLIVANPQHFSLDSRA